MATKIRLEGKTHLKLLNISNKQDQRMVANMGRMKNRNSMYSTQVLEGLKCCKLQML